MSDSRENFKIIKYNKMQNTIKIFCHVLCIKHRASTKKLHTFKITQKNMLHTYNFTPTPDRKTLKSFVSNDPGDYCCFSCLLAATCFENG
jgi:hypothetical protein